MPSIFIWKADSPNTSKKTIRYYSGSNWVLEDNDYSSKSYIYLEQIVISESDNSVITFHSRDMPQDWVGTELLEVSNIPYEFIKSDMYGTLEKIGDWMRFISKGEINFCEKNLKEEFIQIKKWIGQNKQNKKNYQNTVIQTQHNINNLDPNKIQIDFQNFLNKYNLPNTLSINNLNISNNYLLNKSFNTKKDNNQYNNYRNNNNYNRNTNKYNNKKLITNV
jgi:hypothetical protein